MSCATRLHAAVAVAVLFQQVPSIVASCLPNAKSPELLQNLTSMGKSYPIGLWVNDWDAAHVTSGVVHILLKDGGGELLPPFIHGTSTNARNLLSVPPLPCCALSGCCDETRVAPSCFQEILGYNVVETGPGPGSLNAFAALMGCMRPLNLRDLGCVPSITYNHINVEQWPEDSVNQWTEIKAQNPPQVPDLRVHKLR